MEISRPRDDLTKLQMALHRLPSGLFVPTWLACTENGAALVSVTSAGPQTAGVLREHATLTTTAENGTFTADENITQLKFNLFLTAAATTKTDLDQLLADAWVCFDPPSNAVGDIWLTQGDHLTDAALRYRIGMNEPLIVNFPAGYVGGYRIKAGHLATGQTIGCTVEAN